MLQRINWKLNMDTNDIATIRDVDFVKQKVTPEEWRVRVDLAACYWLVRGKAWNMNMLALLKMQKNERPSLVTWATRLQC